MPATTSPPWLEEWKSYVPGPIQVIPTLDGQPTLLMHRLDIIQSWAEGNKYFKLKYVIRHALENNIKVIVSKGGMFSNHLAALSAACSRFNLRCVALIRSHGDDELNPSVRRLRDQGCEIYLLPPESYRAYGPEDARAIDPDALFIPEGGLSDLGILGASEIAAAWSAFPVTHAVLAGGTMSTAIGILSAVTPDITTVIVPAWKGCTPKYVRQLLEEYKKTQLENWELWPDYHFGGFGRFDHRLMESMDAFTTQHTIPLDPVYTGKMVFAVLDKIKAGYFKTTDVVMMVHTGGLQGLDGYAYRFPEVWGRYVAGIRS